MSEVSDPKERVTLGKTDLRVSPLGLGTWAWGDRIMWGYGNGYRDSDLEAAYRATVDADINFLDTAELYGFGQSEKLLARFTQADKRPVILASKFMPLPWRLRKGQLISALRGSLKRLNASKLDLYQIHWPSPPVAVETWAEGLADTVEAGLTRAVGVSNYNADQMRRAHGVLAKRAIPLASNQVEYSLLDRSPERNGVFDACRELGITLIAYSPLAMGMLTGKYTPDNPPPFPRRRQYNGAYLARIQPLIGLMKQIGEAHGGKSPAQVALNWVICKGAIPIPGAKTVSQAQHNVGALGWRLTDAEVMALDDASRKL